MKYSVFKSETKGSLFYDWDRMRYKITRENGKYDRYCGSVMKFRSTPCEHIVVDHKRYLHFPKKNHCCVCCTSKGGCDVLKPNWLQGAIRKEDYLDEAGKEYHVWDKKGL